MRKKCDFLRTSSPFGREEANEMHSRAVESGNPLVLLFFGGGLQIENAVGHFNVELGGVHCANASVVHLDLSCERKTIKQRLQKKKKRKTLRSRVVFALEVAARKQIILPNKKREYKYLLTPTDCRSG